MSVPATSALAVRAREAVASELAGAGIDAATDAGAFYPAPAGVLVGLPALAERGLASATYRVPVNVVSGDPLNEELTVSRLFALADDCARVLSVDQYRPQSWQGGTNQEPLPAVYMEATVTLAYYTEEA